MLQAMRSGAKSIFIKIFLFGILLMAMGGLAIMDVQGMFRQGVKHDVVAVVAGEKIHTPQLDNMVQRVLRQQNIPASTAYQLGLPQQILDSEINTRLFAHAAKDLGLVVDDATVAGELRNLLEPALKQGMFEKDALNTLLQRSGMSEAVLVETLRRDLATESLMQSLGGGIRAPKILLDEVVRFRNEERQGQYFTLTSADAGKIEAPTTPQLEAHYQKIQNRFMQPEQRDLAVLVIDKSGLGKDQSGQTPEAQAEAIYAEANRIDDMLAGGKGLDAVAAETGQKIKLYKAVGTDGQMAAGEKFDLKSGKDTAKAQVLRAAFALRENEASQMIELDHDAFAVVEVRKVIASAPKPFADVRETVAKDLQEQKTIEALQKKASDVVKEANEKNTFESVAAKYGKSVKSQGWLKRVGDKPAEALSRALFAIEKTGTSAAVRDGKEMLVVRLTERRLNNSEKVAETEIKKLQDLLDTSLQNDILAQYRQHLAERYNVKTYPDVITAMYKRSEDSVQ